VGPFTGRVWRIVREDRDPLVCSATGGRWDDGTVPVLCTATSGDGARAEMHFHLSRGQPVMPSRLRYRLYELTVSLAACVTIGSLDALARLGVRTETFGQLSYQERQKEYPRSQDIGEAAAFHGRDGLLVPSARGPDPNLVVICEAAGPAAVAVVAEHGLVDWTAWRRSRTGA
jgi:hypothetical protein